MKKKKLAARICSAALAAAMVLGTAMTASASEDGGVKVSPNTEKPGNFVTGADTVDTSYPDMSNVGEEGVVQYIDLETYVKTEGVTYTGSDKGRIEVSGLGDAVSVKAYQFVEAEYNGEGGTFSGWNDMSGKITKDGKIDVNLLDRDTIAEIAMMYRDGEGIPMDLSGGVASKDVAPGAYVIIASGGETKTYGPMVVSVSYAKEGDANAVAGQKLILLANRAFAKVQDSPDIEKAISKQFRDLNLEGHLYGDNGLSVTATDGYEDYLYFDILVRNIPEYHGDNATFIVKDIMGPGLEWSADDFDLVASVIFDENTVPSDVFTYTGSHLDEVTVTGGNEVDISSTVHVEGDSETGTEITFDLSNEFYKANLKQYAGYDLFIRYGAWVTIDKYDDNNVGHATNKATLTYAVNSVIDGTKEKETNDRDVYSFRFDVKKVDNSNKALPGAVFTLTAKKGGDFEIVSDASGEDGMILFEGLAPGVYELKETTAPEGFSKLDKTWTVEIEAVMGGATFKEARYRVDSDKEEDWKPMAADLVITNTRLTELPSTGGAGTALLLIIGIGGAIAGFIVLAATRKKDEEK